MELNVELGFAAAHHLPNTAGRCRNPHGHNYRLAVTLSGEPDATHGWIVDFDELLERLHKDVLVKVDGVNLNDLLENPTAENIVQWLWTEIAHHYPQLSMLELWETPNCSVRYRGPSGTRG